MNKNKKKQYNKRLSLRTVTMAAALLAAPAVMAASKGDTIRGRVIDDAGRPVVGAYVNVSEEFKKACTDSLGYFVLKNIEPKDELFVTYVGYKEARVKPRFDGNLVIRISPADPYEEMQPVAFGEKKRKLTTEAISTVGGEELEKHPVTVLQNAFTATLNGVETYEAQSEPGWSETSLYIRGIRTMNSNARAPLVIIDDVERDLSFLDAYPIESVTVLKDAAATAIYGMRGANGVILVKTKRGKAGKLKVDFTHEFGLQMIAGIPESQNSYNYALTMNQARYLDGLDPLYSDYDLEQLRKVCNGEELTGMDKYHYFNTNWHDVMLRQTAPQSRTNLQFSGGTDRARYYVSFSYLRQEGMFDNKWTKWTGDYNNNETLNRYNLRANVDIKANKFLNIGLDLGGRIDNITQPGIDVWNLFTWGAGENHPDWPVFCPNGEFFMPTSSDSKNGAAQLAGRGLEQNRRRNLYSTVNATGDIGALIPSVPALNGLKANAVISFDAFDTFRKTQVADIDTYYYDYDNTSVTDPSQYTYKRVRTYAALPDPTTYARQYTYNINTRFGLSYEHEFKGGHYVNAQAFFRSYKNTVRGANSSFRYLSWNAQAMYAFKERYVINASVSRMGSDNFVKNNRWDTFPGVGFAWVISEEPLLKKFKDNGTLQLLKFRMSYGEAGQAMTYALGDDGSYSSDGTATGTIGRYPYQSIYAQGSGYNFGTTQSYVEGAYEKLAGNPNNIWEKSKMINFGFDFDLLKHKLYGSLDFFKEKRSQILVDRSTVPTLMGITSAQDSYGRAETHGMEAKLGHQYQVNRHFGYHFEWNVTYNTNMITEMDELPNKYSYQNQTGKRIGQYFMYKLDQWASDPNLIPTSQQDAIDHPEKYPYSSFGTYKLGNAVFKDVNGDRIINDYDRVASGYSNSKIPEIVHSFNIGFNLYGFDARVILTAYLNRTVECRENMDYGFGWGGTSTHEVTKTWGYYTDDPLDPRNINAKYPRLSTSFSDVDRNYPANQSNIWEQNGNFWSLRNIEVGYSFPTSWIAKAYLTKLRVYFSAYNIATFSHFDNGFDPENPTNYIWAYPKTKTFSFGVNVSF